MCYFEAGGSITSAVSSFMVLLEVLVASTCPGAAHLQQKNHTQNLLQCRVLKDCLNSISAWLTVRMVFGFPMTSSWPSMTHCSKDRVTKSSNLHFSMMLWLTFAHSPIMISKMTESGTGARHVRKMMSLVWKPWTLRPSLILLTLPGWWHLCTVPSTTSVYPYSHCELHIRLTKGRAKARTLSNASGI